MLQIVDVINSILQSIIYSIFIYYCIGDTSKKMKLKIGVVFVLLFIDCTYITTLLGNISICVFLVHILCLAFVAIIVRKNFQAALIGYSIIYMFIGTLAVVDNNVFYGIMCGMGFVEDSDIMKIAIMYIPQVILAIIVMLKRKKIKQLYVLITNKTKEIYMIIISTFILDWIIASNLMIYNDEKDIQRNISITIICIFFILIISYFARVKQKADEIFKLNVALEEKNKELRKIKHDYGAQISYLYGLHLMKRFDELGESLKKIINNNKSVDSAVEINENNNVLLSLATQNALDEGIHVIIDDRCSIKKINMDEMELYRIIKNIVNNAVKAMNGKGIIKLEIFEQINNVIIKICNNGPKIPNENLQNIFKSGFTTKDNTDGSHGFGLSIVKELVESHRGEIIVKSTEELTEFKIVLPIRNEN